MKNKIYVVVLLLMVLVVGGWQMQPTKYEYKMASLPSEKKLNELGSEGWELCAIEAKGGAMGSAPIGTYVFKRAK